MTKLAKLISIGNSKGIRIPKPMLINAGLSNDVIIEEMNGGLFIHSPQDEKLSWEETYKAIKSEQEEFSDWNIAELENWDEH